MHVGVEGNWSRVDINALVPTVLPACLWRRLTQERGHPHQAGSSGGHCDDGRPRKTSHGRLADGQQPDPDDGSVRLKNVLPQLSEVRRALLPKAVCGGSNHPPARRVHKPRPSRSYKSQRASKSPVRQLRSSAAIAGARARGGARRAAPSRAGGHSKRLSASSVARRWLYGRKKESSLARVCSCMGA
jgi:hypothetical protein